MLKKQFNSSDAPNPISAYKTGGYASGGYDDYYTQAYNAFAQQSGNPLRLQAFTGPNGQVSYQYVGQPDPFSTSPQVTTTTSSTDNNSSTATSPTAPTPVSAAIDPSQANGGLLSPDTGGNDNTNNPSATSGSNSTTTSNGDTVSTPSSNNGGFSVSGMMSGAKTGASIGSTLGLPGTALGGLLGAIAGGLLGNSTNSEPSAQDLAAAPTGAAPGVSISNMSDNGSGDASSGANSNGSSGDAPGSDGSGDGNGEGAFARGGLTYKIGGLAIPAHVHAALLNGPMAKHFSVGGDAGTNANIGQGGGFASGGLMGSLQSSTPQPTGYANGGPIDSGLPGDSAAAGYAEGGAASFSQMQSGFAQGGAPDDKIKKIVDLQMDRAAYDRGEKAAGSPSSSFIDITTKKPEGDDKGMAKGGLKYGLGGPVIDPNAKPQQSNVPPGDPNAPDNSKVSALTQPSGATKDDQPAMLSKGEYVLDAATVAFYGVNQIRKMQLNAHKALAQQAQDEMAKQGQGQQGLGVPPNGQQQQQAQPMPPMPTAPPPNTVPNPTEQRIAATDNPKGPNNNKFGFLGT